MILKRLLRGRRDDPMRCGLCRGKLARHELPERVCDDCLRANQTQSFRLTGTRSRR